MPHPEQKSSHDPHCEVSWGGFLECTAWHPKGTSHGCILAPGHRGGHTCACGTLAERNRNRYQYPTAVGRRTA